MIKRNRSKTIKNGPKSPKVTDAQCQAKENAFFFFLHKNRTNNLIVQRGS